MEFQSETTAKVRRLPSRRHTRAALGAASAAVVTAGTLLTASAAGTQPARAAVNNAAAKTALQSYHVSEFVSETFTPKYGSRHLLIIRDASAFDPARHTGQETLILHPDVPNVTIIRYIGNHVYLYFPVPLPGPFGTDGKHWMKLGLSAGAGFNAAYEVPVEAISGWVNSQDLLSALRSVSTVHRDGRASGPGWRGTRYSFTAPFNDAISGTVDGTVEVDRHGRARQLNLSIVLSAQSAGTGIKSINYDLTFSDFNTPVSVTAPSAKQVYAPFNSFFTYPVLYFVEP